MLKLAPKPVLCTGSVHAGPEINDRLLEVGVARGIARVR
jgi:hypothetical protein